MADPARLKSDTGSTVVPTEGLQENEVIDKGPAGSEAPAESTSQQSLKDDDKTVSEFGHRTFCCSVVDSPVVHPYIMQKQLCKSM